jgi:hypothetical protein
LFLVHFAWFNCYRNDSFEAFALDYFAMLEYRSDSLQALASDPFAVFRSTTARTKICFAPHLFF